MKNIKRLKYLPSHSAGLKSSCSLSEKCYDYLKLNLSYKLHLSQREGMENVRNGKLIEIGGPAKKSERSKKLGDL